MVPNTQVFEVVGVPKVGHKKEYILRRFRTHGAAAKHVLAADMAHWDDIWVREAVRPVEPPRKSAFRGPPPKPWSVLSTPTGHSYIVDADGRKILCLLGCQEQRECVAAIIMAHTREPEAVL